MGVSVAATFELFVLLLLVLLLLLSVHLFFGHFGLLPVPLLDENNNCSHAERLFRRYFILSLSVFGTCAE